MLRLVKVPWSQSWEGGKVHGAPQPPDGGLCPLVPMLRRLWYIVCRITRLLLCRLSLW